ncbi:hypothetical protein N7532_012105 [Penicillium argentinense]|uniref:Uncharacterized protein n=1 Tax=Penicillium argentinense TaxID=1131581 RepID=A0A9W9EJR1_9EURO|nr:uncharacterized protein N7532_012105 [Penicillium argentinense]KAJ5083062.1 hypothetical protein N7532_012105 [Penicillium argentinense]
MSSATGTPPCSQCQKARFPCRFTVRKAAAASKAQNLSDGPSLPDRSRSTESASTESTSTVRSSSHDRVIARSGRTDARFAAILPFDETVTPSLVAKAACAQQTQLYINFVLAAFPCYFKATETRVPINWVEYVESRGGITSSPFDWAIRSLTTIYTGSLYNDPRYIDAGRELYLRSLRGLSNLLSDAATAKSDEALSAAIALTVFEMHACTTPDGWIHHASGIRALMRLRGPQAHLRGFGCAQYIAIRNTLVTVALVTGEECFLEEPEWQELNEMIAAENAKQPDSSVYTDITERAFRQVVKLPGFVKRLRDLQAMAPGVSECERPALLRETLATRAALRGIHTEFSMSVSTLRAGREPHTGFIGPIPHHFFDGFSTLSIRGIRSAILISNYIIILLDPSQRCIAEAENRVISDRMRIGRAPNMCASLDQNSPPLTPPGSPGRPRLLVESLITPDTRQSPSTDWMDRIATTMGMEGVRISLIDDD